MRRTKTPPKMLNVLPTFASKSLQKEVIIQPCLAPWEKNTCPKEDEKTVSKFLLEKIYLI